MASVDFMKFHAPSEMKRVVRHCDKYQRLKDGHRNPDIDKSLTAKNTQLPNRGYARVCELYAAKIKYLDSQPGANKRIDRVTAFGLEVPCPKDLRETYRAQWFQDVFEIICVQYDIKNVLQYYVHYDEVHNYVHAETGQWQESRVHSHCIIIPEHENRLNGKWFSSRQNMIKLNNDIHDMTMKKYGVEFMDGSKKGSIKRVEQLKHESDAKEWEKKLKSYEYKLGKMMESMDFTNNISKTGFTEDEINEIWSLGLQAFTDLHKDDNKPEDN